MYIFQYLHHVLKLLPLQGATAPTRDTQGAASLALGYVFPHFCPRIQLGGQTISMVHWAICAIC